jgi:ketosteroid isomerase-like protein
MRRYWDSFRDVMDEIRIQPERLYDAGESVVVAMHITAKGRRTAIAVEQRTTGVWTVCDGKVIGVRAYGSLSEALQAMGVTE